MTNIKTDENEGNVSQNIEENSQKIKKIVKEDDLLPKIENDLKWELINPSDVQASYLMGVFFQSVDRDQQYHLKTAGLRKKMRSLFDNLNAEKLNKIFKECVEVQMAVMNKTRSNALNYGKIRRMTEEKFVQAKWSNPPELLSLGFMMGYDLYWKTFFELYPTEKVIEPPIGEGEEET